MPLYFIYKENIWTISKIIMFKSSSKDALKLEAIVFVKFEAKRQ